MRVHYENSIVFLLRYIFIEYVGMRAHESWIEAHNLFVKSQVRIQDLVKGGGPASEAESCRHSEAE